MSSPDSSQGAAPQGASSERSLDLSRDFLGRPGAALVIGGTGGIGAAACVEFARRGSDVAFTYHTSEAGAEMLAAEIRGRGRRARTAAVDLADLAACASCVESLADAAGGIHTLVHAAGPLVPQRHLSTVDPSVMSRFLALDAAAFFAIAHAALPHLRAAEGSIVAVATAATRRHPVRDGLSSVPKAAVEAAVRAIAAEEGRFGVRANTVGPGMLTDGMAQRLMASGDLGDDALEAARSNIAMRRFGRAGDVVEAICFLASDRAGFVTGQHLAVDGGYSI